MSAISSITTQATNNIQPNNLVGSNPKTDDFESNNDAIMIIASGALIAVSFFFLLLAGGVTFPASLTVSVISGGLMSLGAYLTLQQPAPRPNPPPPRVINEILNDEKERNRIDQLNNEFQEINRNLPTPVQTIEKSLKFYERIHAEQLEGLEKQSEENKPAVRKSIEEEFRQNIQDSLKLIYGLGLKKEEIEPALSSFKDRYPEEVAAVLLMNTL